MSKFLDLIENYDPNNDGYYTDVHDFKMLLKSRDIKFGVRSGGVFYIDDPANNKTYVVEIKSVDTNGKEKEEDNQAFNIVSAGASMDNPAAKKELANFKTKVIPKIPEAVKKLQMQGIEISKM